jgi:hypothetical protein
VAATTTPYSRRVEQIARHDAEAAGFLGSDYLQGITHGLRDWETQYRRQLGRALIAAVIFIALVEASVSRLSFGGVELTDLSLPLKLIPVFFAYTMVEAVVARVGAQSWRRVWSATVKVLQPRLSSEHLDLFMLPAQPYVLSEVVDFSAIALSSRRTGSLLGGATVAFYYVATLLLPVIFLSYCYIRLFDGNGFGSISTWLSLAASVLFLVNAGILIVLGQDID